MKTPTFLAGLILVAGVVSCTSDSPNAPVTSSETFTVCHNGPSGSSLVEIPASELLHHWADGDYVAKLIVDKQGKAGDGIHYARITDALAGARAVRISRDELQAGSCRITISVAPGTFTGSVTATSDPTLEQFPLVVDVPDISIIGSSKMQDGADGRAAGTSEGGVTTTLAPTTGLLNLQQGLDEIIMLVNGHPGGSAGNGADIEGLVFQSGHVDVDNVKGGVGIWSMRVDRLVIKGNRFEPSFTSAIDLRATTATVEKNYVSGGAACDICLAGPGTYTATGNRILGGGIDGILVQPVVFFPAPPNVEPYALPSSAAVAATIVNNEVRDHLQKPAGVGVRLATIGFGAPNVPTSAKLDVRDNNLVNNTFGLHVEAGFPLANTTLRGDADVSLKGNSITQSCQRDLLVVFTRHSTALGAGQPTRPYVRNSVYKISLGGDLRWEDAWYSDPAGFGNSLTVDGTEIPNGARLAYDAARTCT
ncbi:MAG: right-handed parallel beta-helix repeat-containing protein [Gemmatimonadaceae bacterium]